MPRQHIVHRGRVGDWILLGKLPAKGSCIICDKPISGEALIYVSMRTGKRVLVHSNCAKVFERFVSNPVSTIKKVVPTKAQLDRWAKMPDPFANVTEEDRIKAWKKGFVVNPTSAIRTEQELMEEWVRPFGQKKLDRVDLGEDFHRECYKYGNPFSISKKKRERIFNRTGTII